MLRANPRRWIGRARRPGCLHVGDLVPGGEFVDDNGVDGVDVGDRTVHEEFVGSGDDEQPDCLGSRESNSRKRSKFGRLGGRTRTEMSSWTERRRECRLPRRETRRRRWDLLRHLHGIRGSGGLGGHGNYGAHSACYLPAAYDRCAHMGSSTIALSRSEPRPRHCWLLVLGGRLSWLEWVGCAAIFAGLVIA